MSMGPRAAQSPWGAISGGGRGGGVPMQPGMEPAPTSPGLGGGCGQAAGIMVPTPRGLGSRQRGSGWGTEGMRSHRSVEGVT